MNRTQGQPLRNLSNVPSQTVQPRTTAPSSRIIASKPGAWGAAGSIGTSTISSSGQSESWAQAMNPRSNAQLDLSSSSFPSLAGGSSQAQNSNSSSSPWQSGPPPQETARLGQTGSRVLQSRQQPLTSTRDSLFSTDSFSRAQASMDEYSRTDQLNPGRSSAASHDRFPPGLVPRPTQASETMSSDPSRVTSPTGGAPPPGLNTRSPMSTTMNGSIGQERPGQTQQSPSSAQALQNIPKDPFTSGGGGGNNGGRESNHEPEVSTETLFRGMSEREKWGLAGWSALHDGPNAEHRALSRGQDLNSLGLNLEQDSSLLRSFPGPFAPLGAFPPRPLDSDFTIPDCYIVQNVAPIQTRISGFTEDTLFYIFYTSPKDIIQEEVATELMSRKWRFHMKEKMWLTRDDTTAPPVILEKDVCEQGYYIWWDWRNWKRARRAYTLRYEDLDDHLSGGGRMALTQNSATGSQPGNNGPAAASQPGVFNAVPGLERMAALGRGF